MSKNNRSVNYFDKNADNYAERITAIQPIFYENTAAFINSSTQDSQYVLDIGNGGLINYKFSHFKKLVCGDLYISKRAEKKYEFSKNIEFVQADITNLSNFSDSSFDTVIVQAVIHHLAESTLSKTHKNVEKALHECMRVLKSDGRLLIVESTVTNWFEFIERLTYPIMQAFFKLCNFDSVYQYSRKSLIRKVEAMGLSIIEHSPIDIGPRIWIMGKSLPSWLTPCGATWIVIKKI